MECILWTAAWFVWSPSSVRLPFSESVFFKVSFLGRGFPKGALKEPRSISWPARQCFSLSMSNLAFWFINQCLESVPQSLITPQGTDKIKFLNVQSWRPGLGPAVTPWRYRYVRPSCKQRTCPPFSLLPITRAFKLLNNVTDWTPNIWWDWART